MVNVLVELKELSSKNTHTLHINDEFKVEDLQNYLNLINNTKELYSFYIKNEILRTSIGEFISTHNINTETKIVIEYDVERNKFDNEIDLETHISCLSVCNKTNSLFIGTYSGPLKVYENGMIRNYKEGCFTRARLFESDGEIQAMFSKEQGIEDIRNANNYLFDNVTALHVSNNKIYFGLENGDCYELTNCLEKLEGTGEDKIVGIFTDKNEIICVSQNGEINTRDTKTISKTNETIKKSYFITSAAFFDGCLFLGTGVSTLYKISRDKEISYPVYIRYIDYIKVIDNNTIIISGQYIVQMINLEPYKLIEEWKFVEEVSGIELLNDTLFISSSSKLYIKKLILNNIFN